MTKISILIADDHELIKDAVALALTQSDDFEVATTRTFSETEVYLGQHGSVDVVMLDLIMPGMNGVSSIGKIVNLNSNGAVVLFSGNAEPRLLQQSIEIGCAGLIPKSLPLKSLASALKFINSGQVFMPAEAKFVTSHAKSINLSERDIFILRNVADGRTNKEIAWSLSVSEVTVKARMRLICSKLDATNRASAVINARSIGLI
ncbi:response regulator transcription factor [Yoonia sp. 67]|uniref:response regulator transcription factor n=1 Tax=Yoonia sp. 67 TaxID=3081449 RepID=UPI002AFEAA98|nr:response regulator transcription factor [Yoonia sp. 67]